MSHSKIELATLLVSVATLVVTGILTVLSIYSDSRLKRLELQFPLKQQAYVSMMLAFTELYESSQNGSGTAADYSDLRQAMYRSYYTSEIFFTHEAERTELWGLIQGYLAFCYRIRIGKGDSDGYTRMTEFRQQLSKLLRSSFNE